MAAEMIKPAVLLIAIPFSILLTVILVVVIRSWFKNRE
ncbi:hypothetical protein Q427_30490 [Halomonas sp. BC04]|nr:hypothetical protein Q427_30490 [Halomonas sp. BC04]